MNYHSSKNIFIRDQKKGLHSNYNYANYTFQIKLEIIYDFEKGNIAIFNKSDTMFMRT